MPVKVTYDFRLPTWAAYGRVLYAATDDDAAIRAAIEVEAPGAEVTRLVVQPATEAEAARHAAHRAKQRQWAANVAAGRPNQKGDL